MIPQILHENYNVYAKPWKKAIELKSTTAKDVQQEWGFDPVFFSQGLKSSLQLSNKKKFKIHVTKVKKQASF